MIERLHLPLCPASTGGGACLGCSSRTKAHEPDITCSACGQDFIIAAENPIARARALRDWPGCDCTITVTPEAFDALADALNQPATVRERLAGAIGAHGERTTDTPAATGGDTPAAGATTSRVMARWVSGRPGWVERRAAVAW